MRTAFKEWAVVVDALGRGDQILVLRKGGIAETAGEFQVDASRFWLFPTYFHQQREKVIRPAQERYDALVPQFPPPNHVRVDSYAEVVGWERIASPSVLPRLQGQHIWREEILASRFDWGSEQGIFALAIRVWRIPSPVVLPLLPEYAGCKSWVDFSVEISEAGAVPVLDEGQFAARLAAFRSAIGGAE
jgi:hypothetical protein